MNGMMAKLTDYYGVDDYLHAAFVYYKLGDEIMGDSTWDALGRELEAQNKIREAGSLFLMKAEEYPQWIQDKYKGQY